MIRKLSYDKKNPANDNKLMNDEIPGFLKDIKQDFIKIKNLIDNNQDPIPDEPSIKEQIESLQKKCAMGENLEVEAGYLMVLLKSHEYLTQLQTQIQQDPNANLAKEFNEFQTFHNAYDQFNVVGNNLISLKKELNTFAANFKDLATTTTSIADLKQPGSPITSQYNNLTAHCNDIMAKNIELLGTLDFNKKNNKMATVMAAMNVFLYTSMYFLAGLLLGIPVGIAKAYLKGSPIDVLKAIASPVTFAIQGAKDGYNEIKAMAMKKENTQFAPFAQFYAQTKKIIDTEKPKEVVEKAKKNLP